ncbi:hypothetical protein CMUS01_04409 [Colletotrichum musicola]|uniref:Uncharacterized protein n=1 Tax=Colletotrichum musicola TaxID=2175873 RepID=A0A8H6NNC0_9PEZI|nr:hypothetical protein CMUS01_04409 [Colletotrichum musicola]
MTATRVPPAAQQQRNPTSRHSQPPVARQFPVAVRREGEEIVTRGNGWATPFVYPFVYGYSLVYPLVYPSARPVASGTGDVKITVGAVTVSVPLALAAETGLVVEVEHRSQPATSRNFLADSWSSLRGLWRCVVEEVNFYKKHVSPIDLLMGTVFSFTLAYTGWLLMRVLV